MKKALKTIAAALLLLNTTSIVNNKMIAVQASDINHPTGKQNPTEQKPKDINKKKPEDEQDPFLKDIDNIKNRATEQVKHLKDNTKKILNDSANLEGNIFQQEVNKALEVRLKEVYSSIEDKIDEKLKELTNTLSEIAEQKIDTTQLQTLTELINFVSKHSDSNKGAMDQQIETLKKYIIALGNIVFSVNQGVGDISTFLQQLYRYLPKLSGKPINESTNEYITNDINGFINIDEQLKTNKEQKQKHETDASTSAGKIQELTKQLEKYYTSTTTIANNTSKPNTLSDMKNVSPSSKEDEKSESDNISLKEEEDNTKKEIIGVTE